MMQFFLGTHHPDWLGTFGLPLFVSRRALYRRARMPRAIAPWGLDSGGFTELNLHGRWTLASAEYAREVRRYRDEIGELAFAAPQDWMCEPFVLTRTGLRVEEHQRRTIENLLELRTLAPEVPWIPVLQGWCEGDYWDHAEAYDRAGVDLRAETRVGIGSVCRRQNTFRASNIIATLAAEGMRLHGFGFKVTGLRASSSALVSADSLAWSLNARRSRPLPGHTHKSCANCPEWAKQWREELLARLGVVGGAS